MLGKEGEVVEEGSVGGGNGNGNGNDSVGGVGSVSGGRKVYWRSASWSSSHVPLPPLVPEKEGVGGSGRRPVALTPRSNSKGRSFLPPLNIARRSLDEWPRAGSDDVGEWPSTPCGRDLNNGERLKLDLSAIQRVPDKNGGLVKRDRIASFDKKCSKIAEHIFLGGDSVARDKDILKQHKITHVLNCVGFVCPEYFKGNFVYRTLWLQDSPSEDITSILYDVFDYFEDVREQGGRVFVHCCQGVSRSTSLVIAYHMWREGQSFDDAFQFVKAAREIADPNMGFACQLLQCQKRVHAFPLSPSSLLRLYRIAPHSSYDPLHLVPKMLNVPSPGALDSRGAFIMHVPSTIFIWVGKKCESLIERDARGAVCQIVRYEKVQGPIVVVKEGEEPTYFWDAFSSLLPLMDKSGNAMDIAKFSNVNPGERLVDSYSIDFEIIHKASVGGFVPPFGSSGTDHETHLPVRESSWSVLRRKFAVGNMKEFVLAFKSSPSRVYPDSLFLGADNNSNSNFSSKPVARSSTSSLISSSSLSPSFSSASSPDSMSSDSSISSKCYADSPAASPSVTSYTHAFSSTLSTLSNLSLVPTKLSPHSISKSSDFIDVNFTSKSCSQSVLSPSKKSSLSIAERRGGTPKSLKLPIPSDESECQDDAESNGDIVLEVKLKGLNKESRIQDSRSLCPNSEGDGIDRDETCKASQGNRSSKRKESESAHHNVKKQVVVLEWPSLESVTRFNAGDMDSSRMYIFVVSSSISGKNGDSVVYLWVGKAFRHDCRNLLETNKRRADLPDFVVKEVTNKVVSQMGLSKETRVKVVKQDEEPSDFVAILSSL